MDNQEQSKNDKGLMEYLKSNAIALATMLVVLGVQWGTTQAQIKSVTLRLEAIERMDTARLSYKVETNGLRLDAAEKRIDISNVAIQTIERKIDVANTKLDALIETIKQQQRPNHE